VSGPSPKEATPPEPPEKSEGSARPTSPTPQSTFGAPAFSIFGWALGAMSVLNLVQDIGKFAVFGKLKVWLDAYVLLVRQLGSLLFGWINIWVFDVTEAEMHVLVVSAVFSAAVFRAEYVHERPRTNDAFRTAGAAFGGALFCFAFALIPIVAFPGYWGMGLAVISMLFAATLWLTNTEQDPRLAPGRIVFRELLGVLGTFALLVALNYSVFRTDGG
jgi:hypothetical protein